MPSRVQRIIVRRDDNLGDIVISLPILKALRANYPRAEITLMIKEYQRVLCEIYADSFVDPVPLDRFEKIAKKYDLAFNIDYFGPGNRQKQLLRPGKVNHINAVPGPRGRPIVRHLLDGLPAFGIAVPRIIDPHFAVSTNVKANVNRWLREVGIGKKNGMWIGIHVGSRISGKCWSIKKFTRLSSWLHRSFDARLFFFGTKNEELAIRSVESKLPDNITQSVIDQPLDFVAGALSRMDFIIGNDSGIGHLASAVKTPTVSIFGPSSPTYWRPSGKKSIIVYRKTRDNKHKHGPLLSVEDVKQGVLLCIQQHIIRDKFPALDHLRVHKKLHIERTAKGIIIRSGKRGPACLVSDGWRRVKQIIAFIQKSNSFRETLREFPDAEALLNLFILHGIIRQVG